MNEQEWTKRIQADLSKLDDEDRFPVPMPDLASLENWITEQKQVRRKKLIQELLLFWLFALVILSVFVSIAHQKPLLFAYMQAPILLSGIVGFILTQKQKKRVNRI